jgi:hypothetical protein
LRKKSAFVFKLRNITVPLLHNMGLRVQAGGVMCLYKIVDPPYYSQRKAPAVDNINGIVSRTIEKVGSLDGSP